jgi:putative transport protein
MDTILAILANSEILTLVTIIGLGLLLGNLTIRGISFGSAAVLFTALLAGHFGLKIPLGAGTIGIVLFAYCVGIRAGNRFFSALARNGSKLALLCMLILGSGVAVAYGLTTVFGIPGPLSVGIFAGALTSTPGLAAATEGLNPAIADQVIAGYGIAYPFGVIGVVVFVQVLPRLLNKHHSQNNSEVTADEGQSLIQKRLVRVTNPQIIGKNISQYAAEHFKQSQISRTLQGERLIPLQAEDTFEQDQIVFLVGMREEVPVAVDVIGEIAECDVVPDTENERRRLIVTSKNVSGLELSKLETISKFGVVVTRLKRFEATFIPNMSTQVEVNDQLTCVGRPSGLKAFAEFIGHKSLAFDKTDLISVFLGITFGIILGIMPFQIPPSEPIILGLAGGPLLAGLILGHFGKLGRVVGYIQRPVRMTLQEIGLVFFLADAGVKGGAGFAEILATHGWFLFVGGAAITLLPMIVALLFSTIFQKNSIYQSLGGIAGGMTSTPALGALTADSENQEAIISYATAYPIALIAMTVVSKFCVVLF